MIFNNLIKIVANIAKYKVTQWSVNPIKTQQKQFNFLMKIGSKTLFGSEHNLFQGITYNEFKNRVPIRDYEQFKHYIERVKNGEDNILWKGKPIYFAMTSGTTSGSKYIPITKHSLKNHLNGAKNAILLYIAETNNTSFIEGKFIFIQGSPILSLLSSIPVGRLSGISAHHVPFYMKHKMLPSWKTNIIDDWEKKIDSIIKETSNKNMTIISGIPSWVQIYFEKISKKYNKKLLEIFPNFKLLIYGGVNFKPYKQKFKNLIGGDVDSIELFPASEGFYAFQSNQSSEDLLLILNAGIFYEFISVHDYKSNNFNRIDLSEVKIGENYLMVISTSAGLWGYNTGDTVRFTSTTPYKIVVTGRIKQQLSAFGEHVIVEEVEKAMEAAVLKTKNIINEFTVAPLFKSSVNKNSGHEWFIEFEGSPKKLNEFAKILDQELIRQNKYYKDLIFGNIIQPAIITQVKKNGFKLYMQSIGKYGGQNKIPKISNDRKIADKIKNLNLIA